MSYNVVTTTSKGAQIFAQLAGDPNEHLVIEGCDSDTSVLTQSQAINVENRPATSVSTTNNITLSGVTNSSILVYAQYIAGQTTGGQANSFYLYGYLQSAPNTKFVIAVASDSTQSKLPDAQDIVNYVEIRFSLTFTPIQNSSQISVPSDSDYVLRSEFLNTSDRVVTTHALGQPTTGESQNIYGIKRFKNTLQADNGIRVDLSHLAYKESTLPDHFDGLHLYSQAIVSNPTSQISEIKLERDIANNTGLVTLNVLDTISNSRQPLTTLSLSDTEILYHLGDPSSSKIIYYKQNSSNKLLVDVTRTEVNSPVIVNNLVQADSLTLNSQSTDYCNMSLFNNDIFLISNSNVRETLIENSYIPPSLSGSIRGNTSADLFNMISSVISYEMKSTLASVIANGGSSKIISSSTASGTSLSDYTTTESASLNSTWDDKSAKVECKTGKVISNVGGTITTTKYSNIDITADNISLNGTVTYDGILNVNTIVGTQSRMSVIGGNSSFTSYVGIGISPQDNLPSVVLGSIQHSTSTDQYWEFRFNSLLPNPSNGSNIGNSSKPVNSIVANSITGYPSSIYEGIVSVSVNITDSSNHTVILCRDTTIHVGDAISGTGWSGTIANIGVYTSDSSAVMGLKSLTSSVAVKLLGSLTAEISPGTTTYGLTRPLSQDPNVLLVITGTLQFAT